MVSLKKILLLHFLFFLGIALSKAIPIKLILETASGVKKICIKNTKTGEEKKLSSWKEDGGSFFIEAESLESTVFVAPYSGKYRLFLLNRKQSTRWFSLSKNSEVSLKKAFRLYPCKKQGCTADEFILSNFLNEPVSSEQPRLREKDRDLFFRKPHANFLSPSEIRFAWHSKQNRHQIKIIDLQNYALLYENSSCTDSVISWEKIKLQNPEKWKNNGKYQIEVNSGGKKATFAFEIAPLYFLAQGKNRMLHSKNIEIAWQGSFSQYHIKIEDPENGTTIWENAHFSQKKFCPENYNLRKLKPKKQYHFCVQPAGNHPALKRSLPLQVLLTEKEYTELQNFVN